MLPDVRTERATKVERQAREMDDKHTLFRGAGVPQLALRLSEWSAAHTKARNSTIL